MASNIYLLRARILPMVRSLPTSVKVCWDNYTDRSRVKDNSNGRWNQSTR
ncbi:hypothetical protein [Microcoleus sp.]